MPVRSFVSCILVTLLSLGLSACGATVADIEDGSPVGIWQLTIPGEYETTVNIATDGTFDVVDAEIGLQLCSTESGTWQAEGGVLSVTVTGRNGDSVQGEPTENIPFDVTLGTLTLNHVNEDPETFTRVSEMVDCPFYGWPTVTFRATIGGEVWNFTENFIVQQVTDATGGVSIGDLIVQGYLYFGGRFGGGGEPASCVGCRELTIELQAGALAVGTYDMDAGSGTGFFGRGNYWPDVSDGVHFTTDVGNPPVGSIVVTSIGENHIRGTFNFTVVDGIGGASIDISGGVFDIVFN